MSDGIVGHSGVETLSISQVARETGLNQKAIRQMVKDGRLRAVMPYGSVRGCRIWWGDLYRLVSGRDGVEDA